VKFKIYKGLANKFFYYIYEIHEYSYLYIFGLYILIYIIVEKIKKNYI